MFRQKEIAEKRPSTTGVVEGRTAFLKKFFAIIAVVILLVCAFAVPTSAKTVYTDVNHFFDIVNGQLFLLKASVGNYVDVTAAQSSSDVNSDLYYSMQSTESWGSGQHYRVVLQCGIIPAVETNTYYSGSFQIVGNPSLYNILLDNCFIYFGNSDGSYTYCTLFLGGSVNQTLNVEFNSNGIKEPTSLHIYFDFYSIVSTVANSTNFDFSIMNLTFNTINESEYITENQNNNTDSIINNQNNNTNSIINNQNSNTDEITANQDENTQQIIDNQNQIVENEKAETEASGNDGVGELTEAIPDYSGTLGVALQRITNSMKVSTRNCIIQIPRISTPTFNFTVSGLDINVPSFTLYSGGRFDLGGYVVEIIPTNLLKVVRNLLTIGLYVYCVKEFYEIIEYIMTLRSGSK